MTLIFTNTDKGLLQRAARNLDEIGKGLLKTHGPVWSATKEGVKAKLVFDRLQRDSRDLRALAKRLLAQNTKEQLAKAPAEVRTGETPAAGNSETPPWPFPPELKTEVEVVPGAEMGSLAAMPAPIPMAELTRQSIEAHNHSLSGAAVSS